MSKPRGRRRVPWRGAAVFAAGALAGAALEGVVFRRVLGRDDPERGEPIGSLRGEPSTVVSFDGTPLAAWSWGPADAPLTLLFSHGAVETHAVWHYQLRDLAADGAYRLVAYDARGHGASGPPRGLDGGTPLTEYTLARDMVAVAGQLTEGPLVMAGHSLGGMAIQALWQHGEVVHLKDRLAGIALVNTAYTTDLRGWRGRGTRRERLFERVEDVLQRIPVPSGVIERIRPGESDLTLLVGRLGYGRAPSRTHVAASVRMYEQAASETLSAFIDIVAFDAHPSLELIDVPTLVVAGTHDLITPPVLSQEIARLVPDAELVLLEGCGHLAPFERHEEVTTRLRKLCERALG